MSGGDTTTEKQWMNKKWNTECEGSVHFFDKKVRLMRDRAKEETFIFITKRQTKGLNYEYEYNSTMHQ